MDEKNTHTERRKYIVGKKREEKCGLIKKKKKYKKIYRHRK